MQHQQTRRLIRIGSLVATMAIASMGQSILSLKYPQGLPLTAASGMATSMGGAATGLNDEHGLMLANPANLGSIDKSVFSSLLSFNFLNISEGGAGTDHAEFIPRYFAFGFSMGIAGTIGLSLERRSDATLKYRGTTREQGYSTIDSVQAALSRNGGMTAWSAAWGHSIGKWARVGISYERFYYVTDATQFKTVFGKQFDLDTFYRVDERDSSGFAFGGNGVRVGIMAPVGKFTIGVAGEYLLGGRALVDTKEYSANDSTKSSRHYDFRFPPKISGGVSYDLSSSWLLSAEVATVLWKYYIGGPYAAPDIDYTTSFGAGAQFIPAPELLAPRYFEIMRYRAGFRYAQLPAQGNSEFVMSVGTGLPLKVNGVVDVVFEFGRRSDSNHANLHENIFNLSIGVNGGRKWSSTPSGY
jgi:hypothetical protein